MNVLRDAEYRGKVTSRNILNNAVYSICFYESIVCFNIDRTKCFVSKPTTNNGIKFSAIDFRRLGDWAHKASYYLRAKSKIIGLRFSGNTLFSYFETKWLNKSLKKYFK